MPTKHSYSNYLKYSGLGMEMALSVVLPLLLGIYLDKQFETAPWGLLLGLLFGLTGLGLNLYKVILQMNRQPRKPSDKE
jgi:F0F1-type ATP synthase assembly protein I